MLWADNNHFKEHCEDHPGPAVHAAFSTSIRHNEWFWASLPADGSDFSSLSQLFPYKRHCVHLW